MMQFKKGLGWKASIGPPTDMVIDENYAELGTWTNIQTSGNVMSEQKFIFEKISKMLTFERAKI
jgi:hypothetical protein